uniref:Uncharacterized protein n=1 Tax=Trichobilharzia regenti TaxID=157069 RepID=A0AA85JAJ6_TRIRE|nr:unnamed protein product [Trichobilharzia regenti]
MNNEYIFSVIELLLLISKIYLFYITVVQSNSTSDAEPEDSQFFGLTSGIALTIGSQIWSFLSGCFLSMENLEKLFFP